MTEREPTEQLTNSQWDGDEQVDNINSSTINKRLPQVRRSSDLSDQFRIRTEAMRAQNSMITMKRTMVSEYHHSTSEFDNDLDYLEKFSSLERSHYLKFNATP